jgi:hypothetical protein|tara:strand:- start:196 stop:516 length:321 start_codon:yes stop_codon:yes gene_type:complete
MDSNDVLLMQDPNFLMVLLAALIKKAGGSTKISVKDVEGLTNDEALGLFRDLDDEDSFVLKIVSRQEYKEHLGDRNYYSNTKAKKEAGIIKEQPRYALYDDEDWEN